MCLFSTVTFIHTCICWITPEYSCRVAHYMVHYRYYPWQTTLCAVLWGIPSGRIYGRVLLSCSRTLFHLMAIQCNIFHLGCWGFVCSVSSVHPLEQAFQEAQRSRESFSPGNQESIDCLGTCVWGRRQTLLPQFKGLAWDCSFCITLSKPLGPCKLLEGRMGWDGKLWDGML